MTRNVLRDMTCRDPGISIPSPTGKEGHYDRHGLLFVEMLHRYYDQCTRQSNEPHKQTDDEHASIFHRTRPSFCYLERGVNRGPYHRPNFPVNERTHGLLISRVGWHKLTDLATESDSKGHQCVPSIMYQEQFYKSTARALLAEQVRGDGFDPFYISDPPNHVYPAQRHAETKLLAFLQGNMEVKVEGKPNQTYMNFSVEFGLGNRINHISRKGAKDAKG